MHIAEQSLYSIE